MQVNVARGKKITSRKQNRKGLLLNSVYEAIATLISNLDKISTRKENYRPISFMNKDTKVLNKITILAN